MKFLSVVTNKSTVFSCMLVTAQLAVFWVLFANCVVAYIIRFLKVANTVQQHLVIR